MILNVLSSLFGRTHNEPFVAVDIGTSTIKVMSLDQSGGKCRLLSVGSAPTPASAINNNALVRPDQIASVIRSVIEANAIKGTKATISVPGPSVFTKKITIAQTPLKDLATNISFEASNYIPHNIDAVHLDFQVVRSSGSTMDVLLIAVKNEIVRGYVQAIEQAGLEAAIADVDYFAMENMFELNYPEESDKTVALVNIGSRYTSVNILEKMESLFNGDVGVGGRLYTDALCETVGMKPIEAEQAKMGAVVDGYDPNLVNETLDRTTEHVASEIHRQLGFFWNAAATDNPIEAVYLCGGGSQIPGLLEELAARTGMPVQLVEPFRKVEIGEGFDQDYLDEVSPSMGVSVGLAVRRFGDKEHRV